MSRREPVLPAKLMLMLAWATLVGLVGGACLTLAVTDTQTAARVRQAFLMCPDQQPSQQEIWTANDHALFIQAIREAAALSLPATHNIARPTTNSHAARPLHCPFTDEIPL